MTNPYDGPLFSRDEIVAALSLMMERMDHIDAACAGGFPLYSPGAENRWVASSGGSWSGGFWCACWWLRARVTGALSDRRKASETCLRLAPRITSASLYRCMIFWYGAALGDLWFHDCDAGQLATRSASALAAAYDPNLRCIPLGTDFGGGEDGDRRIAVDPLAASIGLASFGGKDALARQHAETTIAACGTLSGAYHAQAVHEGGQFLPMGRPGSWSRGQAWAMLGLVKAAARWGEPFIGFAREASAYWLKTRPGPFPPDRLENPSGPCDPSASVIASLAMLTVAELVSDGALWSHHARRHIAAIIRSRYFAGSSSERNGVSAGAFAGAYYRTTPEKQELIESPWSSALLMMALAILAGALEPSDC